MDTVPLLSHIGVVDGTPCQLYGLALSLLFCAAHLSSVNPYLAIVGH